MMGKWFYIRKLKYVFGIKSLFNGVLIECTTCYGGNCRIAGLAIFSHCQNYARVSDHSLDGVSVKVECEATRQGAICLQT